MERFARLAAELEGRLGPGVLVTDDDTRATYGTDWTRVFPPRPCAVAFPRTTEHVQDILRACSKHQMPVVPSGGRTGLAGGAVATNDELVLSLSRLDFLGEVDAVARRVRVGAGVITRRVHEHCRAHGLTWPVDFASSGSSQVGGNIATNAGGVRVVRYGVTRAWVQGLRAVTVGGEILELGGLDKDNTGADLMQLLIGSEGTLAVITEATLRLAPLPVDTRVALLAVDDLAVALKVFAAARHVRGAPLQAFEFFEDTCLQAVLDQGHGPFPLDARAPAYVLLELEVGDAAAVAAIEEFIEARFAAGEVHDGTLAQSSKEAQALWALRENISESLSRTGFLHKNDISVPVSRLAEFVRAMRAAFAEAYPDYPLYVFGHVGDGNLHINVIKPESLSREAFLATCHRADEILFGIVRQCGGSISAEHGIGLLKKAFLGFRRGPEEMRLLRGLKQVFDPQGLLNPGKVFDP